jgi:hypothetical protein
MSSFRRISTQFLKDANYLNDNLMKEEDRIRLEQKQAENWDKFYMRNSSNFFKDRHWITREFPEVLADQSCEMKCLLEVGCGTGNTFVYITIIMLFFCLVFSLLLSEIGIYSFMHLIFLRVL